MVSARCGATMSDRAKKNMNMNAIGYHARNACALDMANLPNNISFCPMAIEIGFATAKQFLRKYPCLDGGEFQTIQGRNRETRKSLFNTYLLVLG